MIKWTLPLFLTLFTTQALAVVDMKNASFVDVWTDYIASGGGFDLRIRRGYKSRSLFNGMFGFGWCSDFESSIKVTPEGNLKMTECGAGLETIYTQQSFSPKEVNATVKKIMTAHRNEHPHLKKGFYKNFRSRLLTNVDLRSHFASLYKIKTPVKSGATYYAQGTKGEKITFAKGIYTRVLSKGSIQKYNNKGKLVYVADANKNHIKLNYRDNRLHFVIDNKGRQLTFKYFPTSGKVKSISAPGNKKVTYKYSGQDLVQVHNAWKHKYKYTYDDVHNLTRIDFPDTTFKALTYNIDKDWVLSFRARNGCLERYDYKPQSDDPKNHYVSSVIKKCGKKVVTRARYEFWHKKRKDGQHYLQRVKSSLGTDISDITYHPRFGRPISVGLNGKFTDYEYFEDGQVKSKTFGRQKTFYEYKNKYNKVSKVVIVDYNKKGKIKKRTTTKFFYDRKTNLVAANSSNGKKIKLKYDSQSRISRIEDQAKLVVNIKYEGKFGKPSVVERPGVGTIYVKYKPSGEIAKVTSKQGPIVAGQVTRTFNNLLDIIAPANEEFTF